MENPNPKQTARGRWKLLVLISGGDQLGGAAPFVHTMFR